METTIAYWGYIGIMDKRMDTSMRFRSSNMRLGYVAR